jgi:ketosteroid isomerase-like protein
MLDLYLTDTVTWVRVSEPDEWGTRSELARTPVKARVEKKTRLVRTFDGEEVASGASVLLAAEPGHADRICLFGDTVDRAVVAVDEVKDFQVRGYRAFLA